MNLNIYNDKIKHAIDNMINNNKSDYDIDTDYINMLTTGPDALFADYVDDSGNLIIPILTPTENRKIIISHVKISKELISNIGNE